MSIITYDLKNLLEELTRQQPDIEEAYIFGSRAYRTGSLRSDCDILLRLPIGKSVKASALREFARERCAALDFFVANGGHATSVANESFVWAACFEDLVAKLEAIRLWTRAKGIEEIPFAWEFETSAFAEFPMTGLPDEALSQMSWHARMKRTEEAGLPVAPYIGDTVEKGSAFAN